MWRRRSSNSAEKSRDTLIKTALVAHLGEAVQQIQREQSELDTRQDAVESSSEAAHTLCCVLEAIFVHRLRDSFVERFSSVFTGDVDKQPAPNFWPFLLSFSHRNVIEQLVKGCSWLKSDIGRCRAWIRLVLNDGLLTSYLELIGRERRILTGFYEKGAFLRDTEHVDIARKILSGLETLQFKLAINNSILNSWSSTPLLLAGLWTSPATFVQEAVVQGIDATVCFANEESPQKVRDEKKLLQRPAQTIDEDLAFQLIIESSSSVPISKQETTLAASLASSSTVVISSTPNTSKSFEESDSGFGSSVLPDSLPTAPVEPESIIADSSVVPTPAVLVQAESSNGEDETVEAAVVASPHEEESNQDVVAMEKREDAPKGTVGGMLNDSSVEGATFESLLENYGSWIARGTSDFSDRLKPQSDDKRRSSSAGSHDFEILSGDKTPLGIYAHHLERISAEGGLHLQNYRCLDCGHSIGTIYDKPKVCSFTGGSYCSHCHLDDEALIPARVLLNGDWSPRKISKSSAIFLHHIELEPILDALRINSKIYDVIEEFTSLLPLRKQLYHLRGYLFTCKSDVSEVLRKKIWPREHLYESLHLYAVVDLPLIANRQLEQQLVGLVKTARDHVMSCPLCSLKGFVCEVCRDPEIIFPFDLQTSLSCEDCGATFHRKCMDLGRPCPRCQRRKRNQQADE